MEAYNVDEEMVRRAVLNPDRILPGHAGRRIAQKKLDGYVLRVVYEEQSSQTIVVTVYKARRERYEV